MTPEEAQAFAALAQIEQHEKPGTVLAISELARMIGINHKVARAVYEGSIEAIPDQPFVATAYSGFLREACRIEAETPGSVTEPLLKHAADARLTPARVARSVAVEKSAVIAAATDHGVVLAEAEPSAHGTRARLKDTDARHLKNCGVSAAVAARVAVAAFFSLREHRKIGKTLTVLFFRL